MGKVASVKAPSVEDRLWTVYDKTGDALILKTGEKAAKLTDSIRGWRTLATNRPPGDVTKDPLTNAIDELETALSDSSGLLDALKGERSAKDSRLLAYQKAQRLTGDKSAKALREAGNAYNRQLQLYNKAEGAWNAEVAGKSPPKKRPVWHCSEKVASLPGRCCARPPA